VSAQGQKVWKYNDAAYAFGHELVEARVYVRARQLHVCVADRVVTAVGADRSSELLERFVGGIDFAAVVNEKYAQVGCLRGLFMHACVQPIASLRERPR
jgi:hypothetical protein